MLVNFTDSYQDYIFTAINLLGSIETTIAKKEKFMGESKYLDNLRAHSLLLHALIDHLSYDDNSDPALNERLLLCLKTILNKKLC